MVTPEMVPMILKAIQSGPGQGNPAAGGGPMPGPNGMRGYRSGAFGTHAVRGGTLASWMANRGINMPSGYSPLAMNRPQRYIQARPAPGVPVPMGGPSAPPAGPPPNAGRILRGGLGAFGGGGFGRGFWG